MPIGAYGGVRRGGSRAFVCAVLCVALSSCAFSRGSAVPALPPLTPLQIEELQSRELSSQPNAVFKATLGALQGLGYIVESANIDAGFINANTPRTVVTANRSGPTSLADLVLGAIVVGAIIAATDGPSYYGGDGSGGPDKVTRHVRLTANVRANRGSQGGGSILRVSLVEVLNRAGGRGQLSGEDNPIYDGELYRQIFERIEDELFVDEGLPSNSP
ncbi:MAG: hypothetical protein GDA54_07060 [Alphaproteobacteria bacterium GM7ARS4]|nr:hypothetical protein [Alphaproteobacteria bacterium GM7ARS4]